MNEQASERFRAFIATDPNDAVLNFYRQFAQDHADKAWTKNMRWTKPENIHLTLRFLGDINNEQSTYITEQLGGLLTQQNAFEIIVTSPQPFPSLHKARMLASLVQKNTNLDSLAHAIETIAVAAGLEGERRPFRGHLTIARFRKPVKGLSDLIKEPSTAVMPVDSVIFYKSVLTPQGPQYTQLKKFTLPHV
jgi:2'-5' RNA ligase